MPSNSLYGLTSTPSSFVPLVHFQPFNMSVTLPCCPASIRKPVVGSSPRTETLVSMPKGGSGWESILLTSRNVLFDSSSVDRDLLSLAIWGV